jgi:hypothetical protein
MNPEDKKTQVVVNFRLLRDDGSLSKEQPSLALYFDSLYGVPNVGDYTPMPQYNEAGQYTPPTVKVIRREDSAPTERDGLVRYFVTLTVEDAPQ